MKFELLKEMWSDVCGDYCMGIMFVGIIANSYKKPSQYLGRSCDGYIVMDLMVFTYPF